MTKFHEEPGSNNLGSPDRPCHPISVLLAAFLVLSIILTATSCTTTHAPIAIDSIRLVDILPKGSLSEVLTAVRAGSDVNLADDDGATPLMYALKRPDALVIISLLLEKGADINATDWKGENVLMKAAEYTSSIIEALLRAGADVHQKNMYGFTALMFAAEKNNDVEVTKLLIAFGSEVGARHKSGSTVFSHSAGNTRNVSILSELVAAGADVNSVDENGWTPLMWAVYLNHDTSVLRWLLVSCPIQSA